MPPLVPITPMKRPVALVLIVPKLGCPWFVIRVGACGLGSTRTEGPWGFGAKPHGPKGCFGPKGCSLSEAHPKGSADIGAIAIVII